MSVDKIDNKRIAKNTGALYIRMLLVMLVTLYTSRVILETLGVEDFGIYNIVGGFVSILSFFSSSLSNVTQRYLNIKLGERDIIGANHIFCQSIVLFAFFSFLLLIVGETIGLWFVENKLVIPAERQYAAWWIFQFSLITTVLAILQIPFISVIVARERMGVYAYIGVFEAVSRLSIAYALLLVDNSDKLILYGGLLAFVQILILIYYAGYCFFMFPECRFYFYWENVLVKKMGSFISYNLFGCFAWAVSVQGVNIVLNLFFGPTMNAARAISVQVNAAVVSFTESIITAIKPQVIKSYAKGEYSNMYELIEKSSKFSFFLILLLSTPILFQTEFILNIWLNNVPDFTILFVRLIVIESLIYSFVPPLWIAINATGRIKNSQTYGRLLTFSVLPASYLLLKFYLIPWIPFVLFIIAQLMYFIYNLNDVSRQIGLNVNAYIKLVIYPSMKVLLNVILVLFIIRYILGFSKMNSIVEIVLSLLVVVLSVCLFGVDKNERHYISLFVKKILKIESDL